MSGWVVEGWHVLLLFGVGVVCGLLIGAWRTADTLTARGYHLLDDRPPRVNDPPEGDGPPVDLPRDPPRYRGTDVFPQAATDDEPDHPSILPWPHLGERR